MRSKFPWLKNRRKTEPELPYEPPIWFGNRSNGEYFRPATERDRKLRALILNKAEENARRIGMDRREFLASSLGMATALWGISQASGCSSNPGPADTGGGSTTGGKCAMPETMLDESVACNALNGDEFIMDVQTHWFKAEDLDRFPAYRDLFRVIFNIGTEGNYINQMFLNSETTVAALTSWPGVTCVDETTETCGLPLNNDSMAQSRNKINQLSANTRRVVQHVQILPQGPAGLAPELAMMERICSEYGAAAWKLYPGFGPGFKLDDPNGRAVIEKGLDIGLTQFCVHKGLQIGGFFLPEYNYPDDVGVVAKAYPKAQFVIYHSAICAGHMDCSGTDPAPPESFYDPTVEKPSGVNSLIRSLADNGIGPEPGQTPNTNVYGEVGSAINEVMTDENQSRHFFGKLMKYLGTDYVVWGTDCVIYGSPQRFIEWFRNLTIPQQMQEEFGYPPLDDTNKRKILGLNAARLYGLDPKETRCQVEQSATYKLKQQLDEEIGPRRWAFQVPQGPKTREEFVEHYRRALAEGKPG
jgi:uncharacterized protein